MFDKRQNERYDFPDYKVEYIIDLLSRDEIFEAELINANETGLCMRSPHRLTVGQEIILRTFMNSPSRSAVVIWIEEEEEAGGLDESDHILFKVGLQFTD